MENIETPSEEIIKSANQVIDVTDARGRIIKVKRVGILRKLGLYEILGELANNALYLAHVMPLLAIVSIDGVNAPALASKLEMEAYLSQVEEDGLRAVMHGLVQIGAVTLPAGNAV